MRVGYSRISDERQAKTDPLQQAESALLKAGAELILVEVGSGKDDTARPKFRQLREMVLDGKVHQVICPSQDRLGRNLDLVMRFVQLCTMQGVQIVDLNGRELEIRTADGRLMTQLLGALDEHRSNLYGEKTRRHLDEARSKGFPARPRVPFGLRKVRDDKGRFVGIELDPETAPIARKRVERFLAGESRYSICLQALEEGTPMQAGQLSRWLINPLLTGRLAWHKDSKGVFKEVAEEQSFPALVSDAEMAAIKTRMSAGTTDRAIGTRTRRMFSGLVKCSECGRAMTYKISGKSTTYLRCSYLQCSRRNKAIRAGQVYEVLQYSLSEHAAALVPLLQRPRTDPPEVAELQRQIEVLETVSGTESVIEGKRAEINRLRQSDHETPGWLLVALMRSPGFWLQDETRLNDLFRQLLESVTVDLGDTVAKSKLSSVRCRTSPAEAPLPADQNNFLVRMSAQGAALSMKYPDLVLAALKELG